MKKVFEFIIKLLMVILFIGTPILLGALANYLASKITMEMIMNVVYLSGIICFIKLIQLERKEMKR